MKNMIFDHYNKPPQPHPCVVFVTEVSASSGLSFGTIYAIYGLDNTMFRQALKGKGVVIGNNIQDII